MTPFDREDIYELATKLDDVVDYIEEVSDLLGLYGIESTTTPRRRAVQHPRAARSRALDRPDSPQGPPWDPADARAQLKRLEDEGDRIVHDAHRRPLPDDRIDPLIVIRWKDVYEGLERAIDAATPRPT